MASEVKRLGELHNILAEEFIDQVVNGTSVKVETKTGFSVRKVSPGASLLNAARQFLKDNNIEVDPTRPSASVSNLTRSLEDDEHYDAEIPEFNQ
jgi:hypothetical protein